MSVRLAEAYASLDVALDPLTDADFARPTRASGWTVRDLLFHLLLDAQRALVALATPADRAPDVDSVTYWTPFRPGDRDGADDRHAAFVRAAASAYADPEGLVAQWRESTRAAAHAVAVADPGAVVATQGHALTVADLASTLLVEATIHHLDLVVDLADAPAPTTAGLAEVCRVLDGLLGGPAPTSWDDTTYALKGTGRSPLDDADRGALGERVSRFPLLG